jgi:hypothetical protein
MTNNDNGPVSAEDGAAMFEELGDGSNPQNTKPVHRELARENTLRPALDNAARGFKVFPVSKTTKHAAFKGWQDAATTDPRTIREWWAHGGGVFDVGIFTEGSDLFVIDIDVSGQKQGSESWAALVAQHGHVDTFTVQTASGGLHYYYRAPDPKLRNTTSFLGSGIDTRGIGGLVVGAGSIRTAGRYTVLHDLPVAELPAWVSEAMLAGGRGPRPEYDPEAVFSGTGAAGRAETLTQVRALARELAQSPDDGTGPDVLNRIGFMAGQYVGSGVNEVTVDDVAEILTDALAEWSFEKNDEAKQYSALLSAIQDGTEIHDRPWMAGFDVAAAEVFDLSDVPDDDSASGMLPESFWAERPILGHIRQAAHSRGRCGDLVLMATMARLSGMVSHRTKLDAGMGLAVPNLFVAAIGRSGTGKSTSSALAGELVPVPSYLDGPDDLFLDGVAIGSGEGLAEMFMGEAMVDTDEFKADGVTPKQKKIRTQVRHNAYVFVDEGQALTAQSSRAGATVGPILRSAWAGQLLGQQNATSERTRKVPAGAYSLGMVIGFQRDTAQPLFAEVEAGTPQRFVWVSATDPAIPDVPPEWPGQLPMDHIGNLFGHEVTITFDEKIKALLWEQNLKVARGADTGQAMDAHLSLMAMKLSGLFALMDGRFHVTWDDWRLAGQVWRTSCVVRNELLAFGQEQSAQAREVQVDLAVTQAVRTSLAVQGADKTVVRVATAIARIVHGKGAQTLGAVNKALPNRDRAVRFEACDYASDQGWIVVTDSKISAGASRPSE